MTLPQGFWEKPLAELNPEEWEALCDGCGQCCLKKFQDTDSDDVLFTRVVCRLYDQGKGRCTRYSERTTLVPQCLDVKKMDMDNSNWMPASCAYRLRHEGKPLPHWHPLLTGSREEMEKQGIAISGRAVSEDHVHPQGYHEHVIRWVKN